MALIHEKLVLINKQITFISKDKTNQQQGFKYRGVDQVLNSLHALFAEHEVIIMPEIVAERREERINKNGTTLIWTILDYKFSFVAADGSQISSIVRGEGMDSGDKGCNKALSVALKYALFTMFTIPTEEFKDPDAETHEVKPVDRLPLLTPQHPKWDEIARWMANAKGNTIGKVENKYTLPAEHREQLIQLSLKYVSNDNL